MLINSHILTKAFGSVQRGNSSILTLCKLCKVKRIQSSYPNKLGHLVYSNRKHVDLDEGIAAIEEYISNCPDSIAAKHSLGNKRELLEVLRSMR